jgi:hypothetical protein
MIQILLALISSLAGSVGGKTGALVTQLVTTVGTVTLDAQALQSFAGPWVVWVNGIIDAGRDPTAAEEAAVRELAATVHANNQALARGQAAVPLPSPPA